MESPLSTAPLNTAARRLMQTKTKNAKAKCECDPSCPYNTRLKPARSQGICDSNTIWDKTQHKPHWQHISQSRSPLPFLFCFSKFPVRFSFINSSPPTHWLQFTCACTFSLSLSLFSFLRAYVCVASHCWSRIRARCVCTRCLFLHPNPHLYLAQKTLPKTPNHKWQ